MSNLINKMERKFGRYAIKNLMNYIVVLYVLGLFLSWFTPGVYIQYFSLIPSLVLKGQVWRIFTFLLEAPNTNIFFFIFSILLYYSLGSTLERYWGAFRFNLYYFGGVLFTILGAFLAYAITGTDYIMSTYYVNMSIFLAFAFSFPEMEFRIYFILPIKVKWLAYLDLVFFALAFFQGGIGTKICIGMAIANFLVFIFGLKGHKASPRQIKRKIVYKQATKQNVRNQHHKCAVCGRTDADDPNLEFRYCSKCNGNYEYCQDHLFTHTHIQ